MTEILIALPGLQLSNTHTGQGFYFVDIEGWWDSTAPRRENEPYPAADGDFDDTPVYFEPRYVTLLIRSERQNDPDAVFDDQRVIAKIAGARGTFPLSVSEPRGTWTSEVGVAERVRFDADFAPGVAEWELTLKANDPRKYSAVQIVSTGLPTPGTGVVSPVTSPFTDGTPGTPGRLVLTNTGNAESTPNLIVTGGFDSGFEITAIEKGRRIRVERRIQDGSTVRIDMDQGQLWLDELSPISGALTLREWWSILPGETVTLQFASLGATSGTPTLTAEFASADR